MARSRGKPGEKARAREAAEAKARAESGIVPDLVRRALALGLSGFVLTSEALREALGEAVPRDWVDFVTEQSDRTRAEFLERLSREVAEVLDRVDLAALASEVLSEHTIEVKAEIRFSRRDGSEAAPPVRVKVGSRGRRR